MLNTTHICPRKFYCKDPSDKTLCPQGSYCLEGFETPELCPFGSLCLEGSGVPQVNLFYFVAMLFFLAAIFGFFALVQKRWNSVLSKARANLAKEQGVEDLLADWLQHMGLPEKYLGPGGGGFSMYQQTLDGSCLAVSTPIIATKLGIDFIAQC